MLEQLHNLPLWPAASGHVLALDPSLYPAAYRLLSQCTPGPSGCWDFIGWRTPGGYGRYRSAQTLGLSGRMEYAHRISYLLFKGPLPTGPKAGRPEVDHLCRRRGCAHPDCLEMVANHRINLLRGDTIARRNAERTHCPAGHDYSDPAVVYLSKRGERHCRVCQRERCRAARAQAKAEKSEAQQ